MKVLITGSTGFIGRNILPRFIKSDMDVYIFGRHCPEKLPANIKFINVNLSEKKELENITPKFKNGFDACIHLAGQTDIAKSLSDPADDLKNNVLPIINLFSVFKIDRFIYVSTGSVYEGQSGKADPKAVISPSLPYAISKYAGELYLKAFHKKNLNPAAYLILRIFNPYGPYENPGRIIPRLVTQFAIRKDPVFKLQGSGNGLVDPMYVTDTVEAIMTAVYSDVSNRVIDICSGKPVKLSELARNIASVFGIEPVIEMTGRSNEEIAFYGDPEPQTALLGFKPRVSLREGLSDYYEFLLKKERPLP